ncbi:MAG TPA: helix-turn-helix domain-containing protein [Solirubrobacteraceae bacterium]|jgi:excisionase family DNA binding protein|nr:helix-turn-helix domain-containing protein [Solirubrobacteraceae bacterium]
MQSDRVPLYVRLPREQAAQLDRLVDSTGQRKQQLVSDLLAGQLELGRIELHEAPAPEVLTLEETAELLRLSAEAVRAIAEAGELPGREVDGQWRFSRSAILSWLSGQPSENHDTSPAGERRSRRRNS